MGISGFRILSLLLLLAIVSFAGYQYHYDSKFGNLSLHDKDNLIELYTMLDERVEMVENDIVRINQNLLEVNKYDDFLRPNKELFQDIDQVQDRIEKIEDIRNDLALDFYNKIYLDISAYEHVLAAIGMDYTQIVSYNFASKSNIGGPYIPINTLDKVQLSQDKTIEGRIRYLNELKSIVYYLPLSLPMNNAKVTSKYGPRRDPITGQWAQHNGIDLVNNADPAILSTAPGVVKFAGWKSGYGKVVDIDHGHDVVTRYAHLSKILVGKGQQVDRKDVIGIMGSTGRSTGPHLHYEVRMNNRPINPKKFFKAGKYVFFGS